MRFIPFTYMNGTLTTTVYTDGGYILAKNTTGIYLSSNTGLTWTLLDSSITGNDITVSRNGQYMLSTSLKRSSDYGVNWVSITGSTGTEPITAATLCSAYISSTGQNQVLAWCNPGYLIRIIYSSNDYGVTWTQQDSTDSASGSVMRVITSDYNSPFLMVRGFLSGAYPRLEKLNYLAQAGGFYPVMAAGLQDGDFTGLDNSNDNTYVTTVESSLDDSIYVSNNSASTFTAISGFTISNARVKISSSGQHQLVSNNPGYLIVSNNYGVTWTQITSAGSKNWTDCAVSPSGDIMVACVSGSDYVYKSTNFGSSWSALTSSGLSSWTKISIGGY